MTDVWTKFDQRFVYTTEDIEPVRDFSIDWCGITPLLWQSVVLKLWEGEELEEDPYDPYDISEAEWFELQYNRGRFPPDVYDRLEERMGKGFSILNLAIGRRSGKTTIIGVGALRTARKLLRIPNPQRHYGMQEGKAIHVAVAATSGSQAQEMPFGVIQNICRDAVTDDTPLAYYIHPDGILTDTIYLMTDRDRERMANSRSSAHMRDASVQIKSYHTNQRSLRGGATIGAIYDEFGWFPVTEEVDRGQEFFDALSPSQEEFGEDAKTFTLSSPAFQYGIFFDMYEAAWEGESPDTLSIRMPSWEAWEFEPSPKITKKSLADSDRIPFRWDYKGKKSEDGKPEPFAQAYDKAHSAFKREWGAEFQGAEATWLEESAVNLFFNPSLRPRTKGERHLYYYAHMDAAETKDAFAFGIGHREEGHTVIDLLVRWITSNKLDYQPMRSGAWQHEFVFYPEGEHAPYIDTTEVEEYIKNCLKNFNVYKMTADQHESHHFLLGLRKWAMRQRKMRTRFELIRQNRDYNIETAEDLKQEVYEANFATYDNPILRAELRGLERKPNGIIEKGPRSKDDMFDVIRNIVRQSANMPETPARSHNADILRMQPRVASVRF